MDYFTILGIDNISFEARKNEGTETPQFLLQNFSSFNLPFDKDLYLNYFLKELLFEVDIMSVDEFLETQFDNSPNIEGLIKLLKLKVIPKIDNIINNAEFNMEPFDYFDQTIIEGDFVKSDGVLKNKTFELFHLYHLSAFSNNEVDLKQRKILIQNFLTSVENNNEEYSPKKLNWNVDANRLGFIISQLVQLEYIDPPKKSDGEINYRELATIVLNNFNFKNKAVKKETLAKYLNDSQDKYHDIADKFNKQEFNLPHSSLL